MNKNRINIIKKTSYTKGPIVYWMSRDQRIDDNWAVAFGLELAKERNQPFIIVFNLVKNFLGATYRQFYFMLHGLKEQELKAQEYNIPFKLLMGDPIENIPQFLTEMKAGTLITDFDPLKIKRHWKKMIAEKIDIPFVEVDAHNIIPIRYASDKMEFAAYTYRPKIKKLLPYFLDDYPKIENQKCSIIFQDFDVNSLLAQIEVDRNVGESQVIKPGSTNAMNELNNFIENKLEKYNELRNNPNYDNQSNLSPYLHFGQLSAQRVVLEIKGHNIEDENTESFFEELIVRRELSDNYCYYCPNYDNNDGFPDWAKKTLEEHNNDEREYIYSLEQFENARTHEDLWNAAQMEMVNKGKMHGYMRMYWAKKILEWSENPKEAQQIAIYLNDKYSIDGRDPNGYTGIAWSIGGVHDRPWADRPVFGKIRYMNLQGANRKFDIVQYINNNQQQRLL